MTFESALLSAVGGAGGSVLRAYVLAAAELAEVPRMDRAVAAVNIVGSFAAGAVVASAPSPALLALLLTGILGGFTTLSSWISALATQRPPEERWVALLWAVVDLLAGLGAAAGGFAVVSALSG